MKAPARTAAFNFCRQTLPYFLLVRVQVIINIEFIIIRTGYGTVQSVSQPASKASQSVSQLVSQAIRMFVCPRSCLSLSAFPVCGAGRRRRRRRPAQRTYNSIQSPISQVTMTHLYVCTRAQRTDGRTDGQANYLHLSRASMNYGHYSRPPMVRHSIQRVHMVWRSLKCIFATIIQNPVGICCCYYYRYIII